MLFQNSNTIQINDFKRLRCINIQDRLISFLQLYNGDYILFIQKTGTRYLEHRMKLTNEHLLYLKSDINTFFDYNYQKFKKLVEDIVTNIYPKHE